MPMVELPADTPAHPQLFKRGGLTQKPASCGFPKGSMTVFGMERIVVVGESFYRHFFEYFESP